GTDVLADFGAAEDHFFVDRLEHALECQFDVVNDVVDDIVEAHIDAFFIRDFVDALSWTHVEPDDNSVINGCQVDVVLCDCTDTAVDNTLLNFVFSANIDLHERIFECFNSTGCVTFDNEVERIQFAFGNCLIELFQSDAFTTTSQCCVALDCFTTLRNLTCSAFVVGYQEDVACTRHAGQAEDLYRT